MFINFRGELRDNFVSHLEKAFKSNGIHRYKDDDALKAAEKINTELSKAIKTSKVHLVLLSKTYAHSSWCLDELAEIFECSKKDAGHMVVPVFYKVDPSDVRRQKGSFGEPFEKHKSRHPGSKLQKWKEALTQVANLSGFVTGNYRSLLSSHLFAYIILSNIEPKLIGAKMLQYFLHVRRICVMQG